MQTIITRARALMQKQTAKNGAPVWELTELAVAKGRELSKKYKVDGELVAAALYLAHTVFSIVLHGRIQKQHPILSANFVKPYLRRWKVPAAKQHIILNSILAHHGHIPTESREAEVMKNAECFKFVTRQGALIYLHDLGRRKVPFARAKSQMIYKMKQKFSYLTLPDCKREAQKNCQLIERLFSE